MLLNVVIVALMPLLGQLYFSPIFGLETFLEVVDTCVFSSVHGVLW